MPFGTHPQHIEPSDALYRRLVDLAPDAMIGVDHLGRIVLVNTQAELLFGYEREELIGQMVEVLVPSVARAGHPRRRRGYTTDPPPRPMGIGLQLAGLRKDGTEFPAEISLASVETGDAAIVAASIRDMTDRLAAERERERLAQQAQFERSERQMLQSQRLESLGQLAGGVAHDFNNLLAVIANYAAFVHKAIDAELGESDRERWHLAGNDISRVEQAAAAAAALTRQLLTFARREVVRPRTVDLNAVVTATAELLERTLGEDVALDVRSGTSLSPILADPGQIQQVLVNLALNARHAMPAGGVLTIATSDAVDAGDRPCVRLTVADTGTGMDEVTLARAFEPFFTTRPLDQGTGLGLATVYGIIAQASGVVVLESTVGIGTTFTATFPVAIDDGVAVPLPVEEPIVGHHGSILVIDDETGIRDVVERLLSAHGHDVLVAVDADAARRIARDHDGRIDLVLSDVIMPSVHGPELVAELREIRPGLRVLYMSGYAGRELSERLAMVDDDVMLLEKPFLEAELITAVSAALAAEPGG